MQYYGYLSHRRTMIHYPVIDCIEMIEATTGRFTDVSIEAGIFQSDRVMASDWPLVTQNMDGWMIYVGNDFHENDYCYLNQGGKTSKGIYYFKESGADILTLSRFSMGNDIVDYNNDGWPDIPLSIQSFLR